MKQSICLLIVATIFIGCNSHQKNELLIGFIGNDISTKAQINRDKDTKKATLETTLDSDWEIYAGTSPDTIDFSKPLRTGKGAGTFELNVPTDKRTYFELVTKEGTAALAERHLPMAGGFNFRDLGGYKTKEGKFVKWGKIIRSDDLATLTDADLNYLSSLPLLTDIDYRSKEEIEPAQDKHPKSLKNYRITHKNRQ